VTPASLEPESRSVPSMRGSEQRGVSGSPSGLRALVIAPHEFYIDRGSPIAVDVLMRALSALNVAVDLVVYRGGQERLYQGVTIHRAHTPGWLRDIRPGFSLRKLAADWWLFAKARELMARNRYDIVHAGEEAVFAAMWFRARRRVPFVYDMDSSLAEQLVQGQPLLRPVAWIFQWCERRAIRAALAVAPVCNALAAYAAERRAQHIVTLHDISQLDPQTVTPTGALRDRLHVRGLMLMYVGNLESYQGIDLLLQAFAVARAQDADVDLVVAGGSPAHITSYRSKAQRLGIASSTHFIGPWPAARLGELLAEADILTAPRIRGSNTPMKIFPYMHSGRPLLVTAVPSHTQILDSSVCELAAAQPEAFGSAIVQLARDPERRRRLGEAGRQFVERNHVFEAHLSRVRTLYTHVAASVRGQADGPPDGPPVQPELI